jgi:hypothetical protein
MAEFLASHQEEYQQCAEHIMKSANEYLTAERVEEKWRLTLSKHNAGLSYGSLQRVLRTYLAQPGRASWEVQDHLHDAIADFKFPIKTRSRMMQLLKMVSERLNIRVQSLKKVVDNNACFGFIRRVGYIHIPHATKQACWKERHSPSIGE